MEISILGPLEVRVDGRVVPLGGPKQRALLAILVLHANEVVSRDRLIETLWTERLPASVDQSLDTYLSRLRRALGNGRLLHRPGGYELRLDPDELDLDRFESLVLAARDASARGNLSEAARCLRQGLALWRGPPLGDVLYEGFANGDSERLAERRLTALEELFDVELALGRGAELLPELEPLAREQPLRERLLAQYMRALYRAGRHAAALAAFQTARHRLAEELGLDPGPQLQELERLILRHDRSLDAPRPPPRFTLRRRSVIPATAVVASVAALATAVILGIGGSAQSSAPGARSNRLLAIGAASGQLADAIELPGSPSALAVGAGSVWVAQASAQTVARVDSSSGSVIDRISMGGEPGSLVWAGEAVWVAATIGGTVKRLDPSTGSVTQTIRLPGANAAAIAFGQRRLWVADATNRTLVEIDPATGSIRRTHVLDLTPSAVAVGAGAVWVAGYDEGTVEAIDPASGHALATVRVGQGPSALAVERDAVWVANSLDSTVSRIVPRTGSVAATIPVGSGPSAIAAADGHVWVANAYAGSVSRIDARRNQVVSTVRVGGRPVALTAASGHVLVGTAGISHAHRGGTLTVVTTDRGRSLDPAFQDSSSLITRLAYDTLVTFQATAGPAGLRLVPDLALALPTPSGGGTTYAFRLRPGIRYADGRRLRASDFRRAIERLFRVDSPGASYFTGVVGAAACTKRPAHCNLARGIVTDDSARTVLFRLRAPDPDFPYKLTVLGFSAPIPPGTPDLDMGLEPVPGTGPYRIAGASARDIRFIRNRFFREWSHAAQPDGNADALVWRFESSSQHAVRDVEQGRADWVGTLIPGAQLRELQIRSPAQLHRNPTFAVDFISLNTRRRPFNNVRVRQALNYAIDRAKIARMYGRAAGATPLCQPLAPRLPGYRRYCPYTLNPSRDGRWSAPDLARGRRMVAASGTLGGRIDVWAATDLPYIPRQVPAYVTEVLRSLGYRARLRLVPYGTFSPSMRKRIQLSVDGDWLPDYPAPSAYIPQFFSCQGGNNRKRYFCDPRLDRQMQRAPALKSEAPASAAALWAKIDRKLVDRAVWVPTVNVGVTEFVSARLRNYQYHPVWGFLAAQAWLHR